MAETLDLPAGAFPKHGYHPIPAPRLSTSQNLSYNGSSGSSAQSVAFGSTTQMIQVCVPTSSAATGVRVAIATNPTADASSALLPNGSILYFRVYPGEKLAALSNDTGTGSINIVECGSLPG